MGRRLIPLGFVVFFVAIFLPTIFGNKGGDPWVRWIFDYQTLIAGTAAVVAAAVTVLQMMKSDTLQERRHKQLMAVELRRELVTAERLYIYLEDFLRSVEPSFNKYFASHNEANRTWTYPKRLEFYHALEAAIQIGDMLESKIITMSIDTLPGDIYMEVEAANALLPTLREKATNSRNFFDAYTNSVQDPSGYDRHTHMVILSVYLRTKSILSGVEAWQKALKRLYDE